MVHTLCLLGYDEFISDFLQTVLQNTAAKLPRFVVFTRITNDLEPSCRERIMSVLA